MVQDKPGDIMQEGRKQIVKEETNLKLEYKLQTDSVNYDQNATHRITEHELVTEMVDLSASQIDAEFASHAVDCQPNYAIGVFKDRKLMLTPLKKF